MATFSLILILIGRIIIILKMCDLIVIILINVIIIISSEVVTASSPNTISNSQELEAFQETKYISRIATKLLSNVFL